MSANSTWFRYCQYLVSDRQLGFSLDISRVRFNEADLASLLPRVEAAIGAMEGLERGAIANADENRMVGHYWLRAPELAPSAEIAADIRQTQGRIIEFAKEIHEGVVQGAEGRFQFLLVIGIGGSALGPQFVAQALGSPLDEILPFFIDNTDPDGIDQVLGELDGQLGSTLVL
ncbi:MAG TPA: glucose-6-phosphate isomerase, partial [Schlesneria sp.]